MGFVNLTVRSGLHLKATSDIPFPYLCFENVLKLCKQVNKWISHLWNIGKTKCELCRTQEFCKTCSSYFCVTVPIFSDCVQNLNQGIGQHQIQP